MNPFSTSTAAVRAMGTGPNSVQRFNRRIVGALKRAYVTIEKGLLTEIWLAKELSLHKLPYAAFFVPFYGQIIFLIWLMAVISRVALDSMLWVARRVKPFVFGVGDLEELDVDWDEIHEHPRG